MKSAIERTASAGRSPGRLDLQPGQMSQLCIIDRDGGTPRVVLTTDMLIEAPNWTPDGQWLIVNGGGKLFRVAVSGGKLEEIFTGAVQSCNNDHILSPDGQRIYVSARGHLYVLPIEGGEPRKLSNDHPEREDYWFHYYLHAVSPDERTLAYTSVEPVDGKPRAHRSICLIPVAGGNDVRLTPPDIPADGPEYSPDGEWIWFNWEKNAKRPGHAQIFRMRPDGSDPEQMTADENVNWFPHFSPDGQWVAYLAYAPGTLSHPADVDVRIRLMPSVGGEAHDLISVFGGQGTLNVNSWSPDSRKLAFVAYPISP